MRVCLNNTEALEFNANGETVTFCNFDVDFQCDVDIDGDLSISGFTDVGDSLTTSLECVCINSNGSNLSQAGIPLITTIGTGQRELKCNIDLFYDEVNNELDVVNVAIGIDLDVQQNTTLNGNVQIGNISDVEDTISGSLECATINGNTLTFTKNDSPTFNVTIPTGSGGGGGAVDTGSFVDNVTLSGRTLTFDRCDGDISLTIPTTDISAKADCSDTNNAIDNLSFNNSTRNLTATQLIIQQSQ